MEEEHSLGISCDKTDGKEIHWGKESLAPTKIPHMQKRSLQHARRSTSAYRPSILFSSPCEGKENANEDTRAGPTCGDHHVHSHLYMHYSMNFSIPVSSMRCGQYDSPFCWIVDSRSNQPLIYLPLCHSKTHSFFQTRRLHPTATIMYRARTCTPNWLIKKVGVYT